MRRKRKAIMADAEVLENLAWARRVLDSELQPTTLALLLASALADTCLDLLRARGKKAPE